jgi:hypothetical protein
LNFPFGPDKPLVASCLYLRDNEKYPFNSDRILVLVTNLSAVSLPVSPNRSLQIVYLQCLDDGRPATWAMRGKHPIPPMPDDARARSRAKCGV